ncbi:flavodoxin domain-containing protein [Corynebacterium mendelii]|uniref:Flavodoxin domain-containing protein n=1 Tax=Corynebacterium mendelii TaxID=2765362 RepID=A0A939E1M8_9CORY|nr:flavodoxin domain-containing protein [Corynebacterium mendelii]MBN9644790.1 hypothetical protein [Corynebacterium mendelii]
MNAVVVFDTTYGSSKTYACLLADRLGVEAVAADDLRDVSATTGPVIAVSPNYGGQIAGADWLVDHLPDGRPGALVTVGMSESEWVRAKDPARDALGPLAGRVERFYLPGRFIWSGMSRLHKSIMWSLANMLKAKPVKTLNDRMLIDSIGHDIDRLDPAELDPVVDWARTV